MNKEAALRSIHEDLLEYIQGKVKVDYDNLRQEPTSFRYNGKTHWIDETLGRFRILESRSVDAFLVRVIWSLDLLEADRNTGFIIGAPSATGAKREGREEVGQFGQSIQ
ncbi:MAG: hypothetical protein ACQET7_13215 [Thermodesulfobacteriota bacterium]